MNPGVDELIIVGVWEYITLPGFIDKKFKAKCDTGADYSSINAYEIKITEHKGNKFVNFKLEESGQEYMLLIDSIREIKSSNGESERRPVVYIPVRIANRIIGVECTLTNRESMKYRMLLGRRALENRFMVDPSRSNLHQNTKRKLQGRI